MSRLYAHALGGQRIAEATSSGHWKIMTILGAMNLRGIIATITIEAATDGDIFLVYFEKVLRPALRLVGVVVIDNLSSHKFDGVRRIIGKAGAELLYLPPCSPDLNAIEKAWAKFKHLLRTAEARTKETLDSAISKALQNITPDHVRAWFRHCGVRLP